MGGVWQAHDAYYLQDQVGTAMVRQCTLNIWRLVDDNQLSRAAGLKAEAVCNEAHQMVKTVDFRCRALPLPCSPFSPILDLMTWDRCAKST